MRMRNLQTVLFNEGERATVVFFIHGRGVRFRKLLPNEQCAGGY